MGKKKGRTVNKIEEVNIEIDYDKLAEAFANVQYNQTDKYSGTREWMKFILSPIFWTLAFFSAVLAIVFLIYGACTLVGMVSAGLDWVVAITGAIELFIGLFLVAVCAFSWISAKEIDEEKDRHYVASLFSNIVALVALIVSLIALVKG